MLRRLVLALSLLACFVAPQAAVLAAGPSVVALRAAGAAQVQDLFIRMPAKQPQGPLQVAIALHGMGGSGPDFAAPLVEQADKYGWVLVAPTIRYGDWTDYKQVAREDPALAAWLSQLVEELPERTGLEVQPKVLLFGHSRGAQLALRFAVIHPDQVAGVAAASAGTYTLPLLRDRRNRPLEFPFGVANLARDDGGQPFDAREFAEVPIWIGVGADDTNPADVPDAWDAYIGDDRRERAERFSAVLEDVGVDVTLNVFDGTSHGLTDEMRKAGCAALAHDVSEASDVDQG